MSGRWSDVDEYPPEPEFTPEEIQLRHREAVKLGYGLGNVQARTSYFGYLPDVWVGLDNYIGAFGIACLLILGGSLVGIGAVAFLIWLAG